jgi:hypothetical protein
MKEAVINRIAKTSSGEDVQELLERLRKLREESDIDNGKLVIKEIKEIFDQALETKQSPDLEATPEAIGQCLPEGELSAKTLYKTLNFEAVKGILSTQNCFQNISDNGNELNFIKSDSQDNFSGNESGWLITLKPERLLVECKCFDQLKMAMAGIEQLCGEHLMYLAKSVSE